MEAFRTQARDVTEAPPPQVAVLGIDETRRGRPRWEQDADTGTWCLTRDRWHTGFVDALGHGGRLGQVEGRTVADVLAWLATTDLDWRKGIGYVAIDMSATYRAAIRVGLPHATVVVDHFHVVQLANKMLSMVRRRTTAESRGRRGRASDPEWQARRRLLLGREDLTDDQFATMWNALLGEGKIGQTLLTAWIAMENLRALLALARAGADNGVSAKGALIQPATNEQLNRVSGLPTGPAAVNGRVDSVKVLGRRTGVADPAFVYLPPQYFRKAYRRQRFPVIVVLSGYPGSIFNLAEHLRVSPTAGRLQRSG